MAHNKQKKKKSKKQPIHKKLTSSDITQGRRTTYILVAMALAATVFLVYSLNR